MQKTNQKEVIYFDEAKFTQELNKAKERVKSVQKILNAHMELGNLFPLDSVEKIKKVLENPTNYRNMYLDTFPTPEIAPGLKMKRDAFLASIETPDTSLINEVVKSLPDDQRSYLPTDAIQIVDNHAILPEAYRQSLKDRCTRYVENDIEAEIYKTHKEAAEALNKLNKLLESVGVHGRMINHHANNGHIRAFGGGSLFYFINGTDIDIKTDLYRENKPMVKK
jgi:predicted translin family RNA/ssDNA-binding protein